MTITLAQIKRTVADIKEDFYEGNDSHSHAEYRGVCEGLDMLVRHFIRERMNYNWELDKWENNDE